MIGKELTAPIGVAMVLICAISCGVQAQTPTTKPPVEAFAVLPVAPPQISPDGTHFAVIRGINGRRAIAVYKLDGSGKPLQIFTSNGVIGALKWAKNDVLITSDRTVWKRALFDTLYSSGGIAAVMLNNGPEISLARLTRIDDINVDSPDTIYGSFDSTLFSVNVRTGRYNKVDLGPPPSGTSTTWLLDGHGNVAGRVDTTRDEKDTRPFFHTTLKVVSRDTWRTLGTYDVALDQNEGIVGLSEDGQAFIRLVPDNIGTISMDRIDMSTGGETKLFQDPNYDIAGVLNDDWTGRIIGYVVDRDMPVYLYFDPKREALQKGLEKAFPGLSVHAVSTDLAGNKVIVEAVGPKTPESYYLYDRIDHRASAIVASYPDLTESEMGDVRAYGYTARDGLHIPAYLTLPPGKSSHNLPLVVIPHGGPDLRDDMTFDVIRQFLANRGYAVLQSEYRGSWGFGRSFTKAGFGQWGLKVQDDISDGVKKAIDDGIADPKRVCIIGINYGGYAALAGAAFAPKLYTCVVSVSGISDLQRLLDYSRSKFGRTAQDIWMMRTGSDSVQRDAASPALHADRITAPVLLLNWKFDVTVPIEQSEIMAAALQKAGKKVEFVQVQKDDPHMSPEQIWSHVLQEIQNFLAANIGT